MEHPNSPSPPAPPGGVLDPADERPAARATLARWLAFHQRMALRPGDAARILRERGGPGERPRAREARSAEAAAESLRAAGAVAVPLLSRAYPCRLANLADPPPLLFVRGDVTVLAGRCVGIVGARAATVYGARVAFELGRELAAAGLAVVSGLARGIDAAAHRGALAAGGRTVAVLPCGPDRTYPRAHRRLAAEIAGAGAVVSELPVGMEPRRSFFTWRNRLISGLSDGLVVVEARIRSGSLTTAGHAADQGIDVFAVPGPITAPTSAGPNRLLRDGAWVVTEAADVLEVLAVASGPEAATPPTRDVSDPAAAILAALEAEPLTRDQLARRLSLAPQALAPDLLDLELGGDVAEDRDGRLRRLSK